MAVNITWSLTNGGTAISSTVDHGDKANGETSTPVALYIRHDGANSITNVGIYIREISSGYTGDFTPESDLLEIIGWGNQIIEAAFGGVLLSFDGTTYPVYNNHVTTDPGNPGNAAVCKTGIGDSEANGLIIPTATGATALGEIQTGSSPNVKFYIKIQIPQAEDTIGVRQFEQVLSYTYTS